MIFPFHVWYSSVPMIHCDDVPLRKSWHATHVFVIWPPFDDVQSLRASALSPGFPSPVVRVSGTPPTVTVVVALIIVVPDVGELIVTVHEPVPPDVVQLDGPTNVADAPAVFVSEKAIDVPFGAFTKPVPGLTLTCAVRTWFVPTGLVAVGGVIWMLASTTVSGSHGPSEPV